MLTVFTSNRMELLADALAERVRVPLSSPLTPEIIVVQSAGMQRWLSMELAARFGVWANCRYPFPNAMLRELFRAALPDLPGECPFAPETMAWRIMGLLPGLLHRPGFEPIAGYLEREQGSLKLYQLAERIADTFDRYTLFRPELLLGWEAGAEGGWQAGLWRELAREGGGMHRARVRQEFLQRTAAGAAPMPERISVFGISYLPPFHLDVLAAAGRRTEVNLFLLNPCREYWGTIVSEREQARLRRSAPAASLEAGNSLLASLGRMGRDFLDLVLERLDADILDDFRPEPGTGLLAALRNDILTLSEPAEKRVPDPGDRSIRIHSCHGPLRELEVLHDTLLELFQADPTLSPRDVLVMTPDIEAFAPYIEAVFGAPAGSAMAIPHAVADRGLRSAGHLAGGLLAILSLPGGRFGANRVMDLLESPPVRRKFGFETGDLETVRRWVEETRIRWGRDEGDRLRHGAPPFRENSWRAGLDRLLLGYAMPDGGEGLFRGVLPADGVEGDQARVLGSLLEFFTALSAAADRLDRPRTLDEWEACCRALLDGFFAVAGEEEERERLELLELLAGLREAHECSGFSGPLEMEVVRSWLEARLERPVRGSAGFLTGRVTFCAMLPMRSIPFRVIALIGMNDGAFPRRGRPAEFDLTALEPRRGDRSIRDEDRYLFLEALLSARETLHISYAGQGMKDNAEIPPSVLVSELLDYLERGLADGADGRKPRELLVVRHRLHPFSPDYFTPGSPLFSYSEENRAAAEGLAAGGNPPGPFLADPLPPLEETTVSLDELTAFFTNPARALLKGRFGISLREPEGAPEESEPFRLEHLERYGLEQELADACLRGDTPAEALPRVRARGELPAGRYGDELFALLAEGVTEFAAALRPRLDAPLLPPRELDLPVGELRLVGRLGGIRQDGLLRYRCARLKPRDRIRLWIEHLALNGLGPEGYPAGSLAVAKDNELRLGPVPGWRALLALLLETRRLGMRQPLPFFPAASFAYADRVLAGKGEAAALRAAAREWHGSEDFPGEKRDPAYRLCYGDADPLDGRFCELALEIWGPVLKHGVTA